MRGLALALILGLAGSLPAMGQEDWRDDSTVVAARGLLFDQMEPQFRRVMAGELEPWTRERLVWFYDKVLVFRSTAPREAWPVEVDFAELTDAVQRFAAEHADRYDLASLAKIDWNQAGVFEAAGAFADVRGLIERNLGRYPTDVPQRALLLFLLAYYDRLCGHWDDALARLDEAEAALVDPGDDPEAARLAEEGLLYMELERSTIAVELGLFEEAAPHVRLAKEVADALGDPLLWVETVLEEAYLATALDEYELLVDVVQDAETNPLWESVPADRQARVQLRFAIGRAEHERADPAAAREARQMLADLVKEDLLVGLDARHVRTWLADLCIEAGDFDEAEALLAELASLGAEAASNSPCSDGLPDRLEVERIVLEGRLELARGASPATMHERLAATEEAFEAMLERRAGTAVREQGQSVLFERLRLQMTESLVALTRVVHGEQGPSRALDLVIRSQAQGSLARELGAESPSEEEVRELVPLDGGLLLYIPGAVHSLVFAIDKGGTKVFELAPVYRIDPLRRELSRVLVRAVGGADGGARERVDELARQLGAELFPPDLSAHVADWESLVLVGQDALGYVPFELLPWDTDAEHARLGIVKAVSYMPSLPVAWHLSHRTFLASARRVLVLAAPTTPDAQPSPEVTPVPFEEREQGELLGDCALEAVVHVGAAATLERLEELDPSRDLILQIVAHGVREAAYGPQGLLLAGAGGGPAVLTVKRVETLAVPPVVVLTACGAWRGPQRRGDDGRAHLPGAFFLAGARTLIVSHTPIDYQESLRTVGAMYAGVTREGRSPARALTEARRALGGESLTPFLVHVVGLAQEPLLPAVVDGSAAHTNRAPLAFLAAALVGTGAVVFLLRRRRMA